jgi:hypothetical protein
VSFAHKFGDNHQTIVVRDALHYVECATSVLAGCCFFFFYPREDVIKRRAVAVHLFSFAGWVRENTTRRGAEWEAPRFFVGDGGESQRLLIVGDAQ